MLMVSYNPTIKLESLLPENFKDEISADMLPSNRMYYNIAKRLLEPNLANNYDLVSKYGSSAERRLVYMVEFKLISIIDGYYHYEIYPEGKKEDKGWIIFNPETFEIKEKHYPKMGHKYLEHAISGFTDKNGNYRKEGMVAWY